MNRTEFGKQLTQGELHQAYLFLGEEQLFHEELQIAMSKKLLGRIDEFNYQKLNAAKLSCEELVINLETPAFFSPIRLIWLTNFETASSEVEKALVKSVQNLPAGVYLIVSTKKLGSKKIHQELQKLLVVVDCGRLQPREVPFWLKQRAERLGLKLTSFQLRILGERLGTDLLQNRTELEKLRTFTGEQGSLSEEELELLLPGEPEPNIFGLIDAVAKRDSQQGLPRLMELLQSGENELKILATLSRQFRNITAAKAAKQMNKSPKEVASLLGINPYVAEKSFTQANQFHLTELKWIMQRFLEADYRIKSGQNEPRLELELLLVEICESGK